MVGIVSWSRYSDNCKGCDTLLICRRHRGADFIHDTSNLTCQRRRLEVGIDAIAFLRDGEGTWLISAMSLTSCESGLSWLFWLESLGTVGVWRGMEYPLRMP